MAFDVKNINFQTRKVVKESQFAVGGVIPIASEKPLKKVLNVVSTSLVTEQNSVDYNHNMRGKINIEMLYLTEEGEYETTKAEFAFEHTENLTAENVSYKVEIAEYTLEEATATYVKFTFLVLSYLYGIVAQNFALLDGTEDNYYASKNSFEHISYLQGAKSQTELEDKIEVAENFVKVLSYESVVKNNASTCGIETICASGEVTLKFYCLTDGGVVTLERQLEYSHEIASLGVGPEDVAKVDVAIAKVDYSFEAGEKPIINAKITLNVDTCAYRKATEEYIEDLFSTTKEIELASGCASYENYVGKQTLQEEVMFEQTLAENQEVLFANVEHTNVAKLLVGDGKFACEGVIKVNLATRDQNGEVLSSPINIPFAIQKETETCGDVLAYNVQAIIKSTAKNDDKLQMGVIILVDYDLSQERYVQYVESAKELGDKDEQTSAISIYVAGENETAFSVAKALGVSPEKILGQNQVVDGKFEKGQRVFVYNPLVAEF